MGRRKKRTGSSSESPTKSLSECHDTDIVSHTSSNLPDYQIVYLLNHKAEVFLYPFDDNPSEETIAHFAASDGLSHILQELSSLDPPENWLDIQERESGSTPLHKALYYGNINCAVKLLQLGASLTYPDYDNFTPLDLLVSHEKNHVPDCAKFNTYSWGSNSNYNLGHPHDKSLHFPEKVAAFNRPAFSSSICDVSFGKYHTLFLDSDGFVYSCGYGPGGRLGHGNEETTLAPQRIKSLKNIVSISCTDNHSIVVDADGVVFTWGLNTDKVLGISDPNTKQCSTPQAIKRDVVEQKVRSVLSAKYHSVLVTLNDVYTFGSNGGQLGHSIESGEYQILPKRVSRLLMKTEIVAVHASAAATVVGLEHGIIFLFTDHKVKKIANMSIFTGSITMKSIQVSGGEQNIEDNNICKPILVNVLDSEGSVYCICPGLFPNAIMYYWSVYMDGFTVKDISLASNTLLLLSSKGDVFSCDPHPNLRTDREMKKYHYGKDSAHQIVVMGKKEAEKMLKPIKLSRVPGLEKVSKVRVSPKGHNKGCVVRDRVSTVHYVPLVEESTFTTDFVDHLYEGDGDHADVSVYDAEGNVYEAHKAVLANYWDCTEDPWEDLTSFEIKESPLVVQAFLKGFYSSELSSECPAIIKSVQRLHKFYKIKPIDGILNRSSLLPFSNIMLKSSENTIFECHKCVLAARTDYFRTFFMVHDRWGKVQEDIAVDADTRTLHDLLYYIYTDRFPKQYSFDSLKLLMKAADQYLLTHLTSFCESMMIQFITEENLIHILRTSNDYNAHQLRNCCLHIIATNMPYYIEQNALHCLEEDLLQNLERVYKEVVLWDHAPYSNNFISVTEWFSNIPKLGTNVLDNYVEEEKVVANIPGLPKVLEFNYVSDGSEVSEDEIVENVEEDVVQDVEEVLKSLGLADAPPLSLAEININKKMRWSDDNQNHVNKKKTARKNKNVPVSAPDNPSGSPPTVTSVTSPVKPAPWTPLQPAPPSLAQIMRLEEEQTNLNKPKPSPVKTPKTKTTWATPPPTTTPTKLCPWTTLSASPAVPSLRAIMSQTTTKLKPQPSKPKPQPYKQPTPNKRSEIHDFNPNPQVHSLADIMKSEEQQLTQSIASKNYSRPLSIIQLEEKALQELTVFYKVEETFDEWIVIRTLGGELGKPLWTRPHL